ncbi:MAG: anthranilate phosphoribosyltransferase [Sporichthyaceae bacterium]
MSRTWPALLGALLRREDLAAEDTAWAMDQIMAGDATPAQIAGFAVALRAKGETVPEFEGLVRAMLERATLIDVPGPIVDIVGTGGDQAHTVNISTMATIVVAATGARVVKHGNRAASSSCGTADVLEELGVVLDLPADAVVEVALQAGVTFCFAPMFHPALRHAGAPRRELGIPTMFNFLGPLANPARPGFQAVGVADRRMAPIMAGVLAVRGVTALVFRGDDGLDELSTAATSSYWEVRGGTVVEGTLEPLELGVPRSAPEALRGGDAKVNAAVVRDLVAGKPGPVRDAVLLNAGAALATFDASGAPLPDRIRAGVETAAAAVDSGAAAAKLDLWIETSRRLRG